MGVKGLINLGHLPVGDVINDIIFTPLVRFRVVVHHLAGHISFHHIPSCACEQYKAYPVS